MNAEWTAYGPKDCPSAELESPGGFWRGFFHRWLGVKDVKESKPPRIELPHAMDRLSFHDGTLWEVTEHGVTREYMALSGVEVMAKRTLRECQDGQCEYRFELNLAADPAWQFYFRQWHCPVVVEFRGNELILVCGAEELEPSYAVVKARMVQANAAYARERENLITRLIAREEGRAAAREEEAKRFRKLQRSFDGLQL